MFEKKHSRIKIRYGNRITILKCITKWQTEKEMENEGITDMEETEIDADAVDAGGDCCLLFDWLFYRLPN